MSIYMTKYYYINKIPVIEIIESELDNQKAPLVIFYHGFTSNKDASMTFGNEIAKRGFRVVMPDAMHHGSRRQFGVDLNTNGLLFFDALMNNVKEFSDLVQYFQRKQLIADDFIAVGGMSMGGMTTSMIFQTFDYVNSAVVLMGTPQQSKFNDWIIAQYTKDHNESADIVSDYAKEQYEQYNSFFNLHDLGQHISKIQARPILFWHSKQDPVVPYHYTEEFVEAAGQTPEGKYVYLKLDNQGGHKVPYLEMARMAEFFSASYTKDKEEVFQATQDRMNYLWG